MAINYYPGWESWKECPICKGYGSIYGVRYNTNSQTGEMTWEYGYIDCTNPDCSVGQIYVSPEELKAKEKTFVEKKLEELNTQPVVTLGDVLPDAFQQIRQAMKDGQMKRI